MNEPQPSCPSWRNPKLSNQKPTVGIGTELPQGTVVSINRGSVTVEKNGKKSTLDFAQVESVMEEPNDVSN
jgi:hypothetical protein